MGSALDALVELLDVEPMGDEAFEGRTPLDEEGPVFGGLLAAQALMAAGRTVDPAERSPHSVFAWFLRPGAAAVPVRYEVSRASDGRSFSRRDVVAVQQGRVLARLLASFHVDAPGPDHQPPMPDAPPPETLPELGVTSARDNQLRDGRRRRPALDIRPVGRTDAAARPSAASDQQLWIRADGRLPDDVLLHAAVLTYASDVGLLDAALSVHQVQSWDPGVKGATLDHAIWFHRPFRVDEWLLSHQRSPAATGARALSRGEMFTADGRHAVSVVQENLIRLAD